MSAHRNEGVTGHPYMPTLHPNSSLEAPGPGNRTRRPVLTALAALLLVQSASFHVDAQNPASPEPGAPTTATGAANDYSRDDYWLCRPGRQDACTVDLTTTIVAADGKLTRETWTAKGKAPIDCFYVYPTVSPDTTPNSSMVPGPAEKNTVRIQLARFGSRCRLFAPMYRQITIPGLIAQFSGKSGGDPMLAYNDVRDAWHYYLQHDNSGRGVVLIGHSQGAIILAHLMQHEIDGQPIQSQIVSALLLGTRLTVPKGKDTGGAFQHVPLCHRPDQTGCVVAYSSFRAKAPPPPNTLFGTLSPYQPAMAWAQVLPADSTTGSVATMMVACTNPAALSGGVAPLHAYFSANQGGLDAAVQANPGPWVKSPRVISTPFVSVPGMLTADCVVDEHGSYLAVTVHADSGDLRATDIGGDLLTSNQVQPQWGLHLIDVDLAMGNLIDLVGRQSAAYVSQAGHH